MRSAAVFVGLVVVVTTACGRLEFASVPEAIDGGGDATPCKTLWVPVRALDELNSTAIDWSPAWGQDLLQLVFESTRSGNGELYLATRDSPGATFGAPRLLDEVNTAGTESAPTLSRDGLELFFERAGAILRSTRPDPTARFSAPPQVIASGFGPDLGRGDLDLVYGERGAANRVDLVVRTRAAPGEATFGPPRALANLQLPQGGWPSLADDGLELFYESGPDAPVYTSQRRDGASPFPTPTPIPELGSASDPDISPDGEWLLYVTAEGNEISLARRSCAP